MHVSLQVRNTSGVPRARPFPGIRGQFCLHASLAGTHVHLISVVQDKNMHRKGESESSGEREKPAREREGERAARSATERVRDREGERQSREQEG